MHIDLPFWHVILKPLRLSPDHARTEKLVSSSVGLDATLMAALVPSMEGALKIPVSQIHLSEG
ncbi:hypothetical protein FJ872_00300 [Mesorhizobium sp. B2-5-9]|uniref:hypothetical protein n=1 Tax=unclassified Mesorhizobium TaxID=325217 RepID=UPI001127942D|nr:MULTISPECIES: hypothetical protein [unclassified Mesorhizobium]TPK24454.1 hypothetical protein FJ872_00300 [Mesorhizobium sp. B2-5-9]TPL98597.1 hypothetical protein FJ943_17040 [Mesorhizobium sp. B2-3-10]